jgi:hypothetical protein
MNTYNYLDYVPKGRDEDGLTGQVGKIIPALEGELSHGRVLGWGFTRASRESAE